jgi:hypothetical protein
MASDHDREQESQDRGATTPLRSTYPVPSSAEALVRIHRSVEHRHRVRERSAFGVFRRSRRGLVVRPLGSVPMVLSDSAIRRLIEAGHIGIDPYDPALMQPSSLDVRVDRFFRVFRNSCYPTST